MIVGLDHVAEDERGSAVGVRELEQAAQAAVALPREHGEHREQRDEKQDLGRGIVEVLGDHEADSRQRGVDDEHPRLAQLGAEAGLVCDRVVQLGNGEVDGALGRERGE